MKKTLALFCILVLLVSMLCGCGATSLAQKNDSTTESMPMAMPEAEYDYEDGMSIYSSTDGTAAGTLADSNAPKPTTAEKIIYSANIQMETMEFDETMTALEKAIQEFGGFVENSEVNGDSSYRDDGTVHIRNRNAFYRVRVPAEKLDDFLRQTGSLGNVIGSSKSAQNVTSQYTDYEARLTSLQTQETRLLELIAVAEDIDALITLESKLAEVRYEIESIQRNLNDLDSRIAYSTVELYVREVQVYQPTPSVQRTFWQRMGDAFVKGWKGFVRGLGNLLVSISGGFFTLVVIALFALGCFFTVRKIIRKRKAKKQQASETKE